jgi:hypothetical protein
MEKGLPCEIEFHRVKVRVNCGCLELSPARREYDFVHLTWGGKFGYQKF